MTTRFDLKFALTLLFTIASVIVPVWLWQAELSSKSVRLSIRSIVEIQPAGADPIDGLRVAMDGAALAKPYVSVLEVSNTGSRPIVASDFEGPIKIASKAPALVVKALLTTAVPASMEPRISLADGVVLLQPLLLNPGDVLKVTLITAGGKPEYFVRGRIAGVPEVSVVDSQASRETKRYWISRIIIVLLLVSYMVNFMEVSSEFFRHRKLLVVPLASALLSAAGAAQIETLLVSDSTGGIGFPNVLYRMAIGSLIALPIIFVRRWRQIED